MALMASVRALHLAALALLAGGFVFPLFILPRAAGAPDTASLDVRRGLARLRAWAVFVAIASWVAWLVLVAAEMSGLPREQALAPAVLHAVLTQTRFGHVWMIRIGLLLLLAAWLAWRRLRAEDDVLAWLLATLVLVSQVWAGHATAAPASHIAVDAVHLIAAAVWLGCLPPLLAVLRRARSGAPAWLALAAAATRRFSPVGVLCVGALAATGFVNGQMMVGSVAGLATTLYGQLVAAKILLFAAMLVLAAMNRFQLTPRVDPATSTSDAARIALGRLTRNVLLELTLGVALLAIVGVLGGSQPAAHEMPDPGSMEHSMEQHHHQGLGSPAM